MNTAAKGRRNEYKVRDYYLERGFKVVRSAGSFGIGDLICVRKGEVHVVNIKSNIWTPKKEINELLKWCEGSLSIPVLARIDDGGKVLRFRMFKNGEWVDYEGENRKKN